MENFHEIMNSNQEEEPPLFLDFPSPFFDGISTTPIHTNNYTHHYHLKSQNNPINITEPLPSESKSVKKRSVSKKDRHSKIHTAQGLRDRRMRLSLHIARKFFDLQDLLGFDKASKTIEWLFCKSNKAIQEVAENFTPQHANKSMSEEDYEVGLTSEIKTATNNPENVNSKDEEIKNIKSRKQIRSNSSVRETRDKARARARDRTRERLLIKELEKSKLFGGNPKLEIHKLGLGYLPSPNNHNAEEIGFTSSPSETIQQESSSSSLEHSCTHHLLQEPYAAQSATIHLNSFEDYTSNWSTLINHNPPAGWLNTCQGFFPGEWDADKFVTEYFNYGIVPNTVSLTGDIYEQNPSSFLMSSTTNILHVQSQNQGK